MILATCHHHLSTVFLLSEHSGVSTSFGINFGRDELQHIGVEMNQIVQLLMFRLDGERLIPLMSLHSI